MASDETAGSLLMGPGGALLIYTIAGIVTLLRNHTGDIGPIVYFFSFIGFLAFLFMLGRLRLAATCLPKRAQATYFNRW